MSSGYVICVYYTVVQIDWLYGKKKKKNCGGMNSN